MSQHDYNISTADANTGSAMRTQINTALQALASQSAGNTAPGTTYAYMIWVDTSTTPKTVKMRNYSNTAWVAIGTLSDAGAFLAADSSKVGGFAASQTPGASQVPVLSSGGDYKLGTNYLAYKRGNYVNINDVGSTVVTGDVQAGVYRNAQQDGTNWVRTSTGTAQGLTVASNGLVYTEAASGGAGATISWASSTVWHSGNAPRVIHARVTGSSGALVTGSGISVTRAGVGIYYVTYSTAFSTVPTATVTPRMSGAGTPSVGSETVNGCTVYTQNASNSGYVDADFAIHVAGN